MEKYLKKGSKVYIEGKLQTRKWTDKDKIDRYSTEVVLQGFDGKLVMLSAKESGRGTQQWRELQRPRRYGQAVACGEGQHA
jgi:single-strand DNA-binding protein